jgi:uncharacterized RDD family membrane protein YckC
VPSEALRRATGLALGAAGLALEVLRVLDRSGRRLRVPRALLRAVLYVVFPAGLLWVLVSRRNASVQDLLVGTAVVYDWSYRHAGKSPPSGDARSPSPAPGSERA